MALQTFLEEKFKSFKPESPVVTERTKYSVTLEWKLEEPFDFLEDDVLYRIEIKKKLPKWLVVYSGGKTSKLIDYLPPRHPHIFRLTIILKATAVPLLAEKAKQFYGDEKTIYEKMGGTRDEGSGDSKNEADKVLKNKRVDDKGDANLENNRPECRRPWLESQCSEEAWTNTETDGSSAICFCMAVCCGYIKQVQSMLEERPDLIEILNPTTGFTPLAGAVKKGDINTVKFLLNAGAQAEHRSATKQTPLHLAIYLAHIPIVTLLLEHGADLKTRDKNQLRGEHYAVDSGSIEMLRFVLDHGGELDVVDNNGWTPLFRALCQNTSTQLIDELVARGSHVDVCDAAGLPLLSVARFLTNRHGRSRDSVLRLVDATFPHERALAIFTRLTKKIRNVRTVFK